MTQPVGPASGPSQWRGDLVEPKRPSVNITLLLFVLVVMAASADAAPDGLGGDPDAAIRQLYSHYAKALHAYIEQFCPDRASADDIVQETFIRAWRARHRFDTSLGTLRTWLFTIARRVVIDHARARAIRQTEPLQTDLAGEVDDVENAMVGWQVEEALSRLRPDHRKVLVETYYRSRSGREVAEELGIPEGTVRSRLFYGLRTLRLALEEMGWER